MIKLTKKYKMIIAAMTITSLPLFAFSYSFNEFLGIPVRWAGNSVDLRASAVSFPPGNSYTTSLSQIISDMNTNPSNFNMNLILNDNSVGLGNLQNEIWFSSNAGDLQGAPAIAYSWSVFNFKTETDVLFDVNRTWSSGTTKSALTPYNGAGRPFKTTAMHELGHLFGLNHVATEYNILGQDWDHIHANGSSARAYFGEDASNGAVALYGLDNSRPEDVGVVHWRWTGNSGEYSTHDRTRIFNSAGSLLTNISGGDEPIYRVDNGQTIRIEFTYENNGSTRQQFTDVGFYFSTNDLITTFDTRLGGATIDLGRNSVWTTSFQVTLPNNLSPNTDYWVGAIVDEDDSLSEVNETNNATYTQIRTSNFPTPTPTRTFTPTPTNTPTINITLPTFRPTFFIPTFVIATPTPTPTPRISLPTFTIPTFYVPTFRVPTFLPTPYPTLIPFPTRIPTFSFDFDIRVINPSLNINFPMFEQNSTVLRDASTLVGLKIFDDPLVGIPRYLLRGQGQQDSNKSLILPNGAILTSALNTEKTQKVLVLILPNGEIVEFAELNIGEVDVDGTMVDINDVSVMDMLYDGKDKLVLFIRAGGLPRDVEDGEFVETIIKTDISGPFSSASVDEFMLHE